MSLYPKELNTGTTASEQLFMANGANTSTGWGEASTPSSPQVSIMIDQPTPEPAPTTSSGSNAWQTCTAKCKTVLDYFPTPEQKYLFLASIFLGIFGIYSMIGGTAVVGILFGILLLIAMIGNMITAWKKSQLILTGCAIVMGILILFDVIALLISLILLDIISIIGNLLQLITLVTCLVFIGLIYWKSGYPWPGRGVRGAESGPHSIIS